MTREMINVQFAILKERILPVEIHEKERWSQTERMKSPKPIPWFSGISGGNTE
jgi:hypothetical protein